MTICKKRWYPEYTHCVQTVPSETGWPSCSLTQRICNEPTCRAHGERLIPRRSHDHEQRILPSTVASTIGTAGTAASSTATSSSSPSRERTSRRTEPNKGRGFRSLCDKKVLSGSGIRVSLTILHQRCVRASLSFECVF